MATKKYEVYYEHTNSGLPEETKVIATFNDKNEAQAVALALNEHHGHKGEDFEGAGDVEGYYVRACLIGKSAVHFAENTPQVPEPDVWYKCEVCGCDTKNWCCYEGGDF